MNALYSEITTGPLAVSLASLVSTRDVEAILVHLTARNIPVVQTITTDDFAIWAGATGLRAVIQDHAQTQGSPLRSIALTLLDLLQGNLKGVLDLGNQTNVQMLGAWVSVGAITTQQRDDLLAMATKHISRADQIGLSLTVFDVINALNEGEA